MFTYFSDTEFIEKLNISSVKDLQTLQTVGAKRAKLIYEWRENYGLFSSVSCKQVFFIKYCGFIIIS